MPSCRRCRRRTGSQHLDPDGSSFRESGGFVEDDNTIVNVASERHPFFSYLILKFTTVLDHGEDHPAGELDSMKTFTDAQGQSWTFDINVASLRRVKDATDIDLTKLVDRKADVFLRLAGDLFVLYDVVTVLLKPQLEERQLTAGSNGDASDGSNGDGSDADGSDGDGSDTDGSDGDGSDTDGSDGDTDGSDAVHTSAKW